MKINLYGEGMKTVSGVLVYLAVCFLVFTAWLICFAQHAPFPGGEQALTLTYLLNVFFVYFFDGTLYPLLSGRDILQSFDGPS